MPLRSCANREVPSEKAPEEKGGKKNKKKRTASEAEAEAEEDVCTSGGDEGDSDRKEKGRRKGKDKSRAAAAAKKPKTKEEPKKGGGRKGASASTGSKRPSAKGLKKEEADPQSAAKKRSTRRRKSQDSLSIAQRNATSAKKRKEKAKAGRRGDSTGSTTSTSSDRSSTASSIRSSDVSTLSEPSSFESMDDGIMVSLDFGRQEAECRSGRGPSGATTGPKTPARCKTPTRAGRLSLAVQFAGAGDGGSGSGGDDWKAKQTPCVGSQGELPSLLIDGITGRSDAPLGSMGLQFNVDQNGGAICITTPGPKPVLKRPGGQAPGTASKKQKFAPEQPCFVFNFAGPAASASQVEAALAKQDEQHKMQIESIKEAMQRDICRVALETEAERQLLAATVEECQRQLAEERELAKQEILQLNEKLVTEKEKYQKLCRETEDRFAEHDVEAIWLTAENAKERRKKEKTIMDLRKMYRELRAQVSAPQGGPGASCPGSSAPVASSQAPDQAVDRVGSSDTGIDAVKEKGDEVGSEVPAGDAVLAQECGHKTQEENGTDETTSTQRRNK